MTKNPTEMVPTSTVARLLSVDRRTVHRMVERGEISPAYKVPGLRGPYLFDPAEIERITADRSTAGAA